MSLSAPLPKRTKPRFSLLWLFALCITNVGLWLWGGQATEAAIYQGFGATTPGGAKGVVVHVTNGDTSLVPPTNVAVSGNATEPPASAVAVAGAETELRTSPITVRVDQSDEEIPAYAAAMSVVPVASTVSSPA